MQKLVKYVTKKDQFAPTIQDQFHFKKNEVQKTCSGGCIILLLNILIAYLFASNSYTMLKREQPYLNSVDMQIPVGGTPEETAEVMKT